MTKADEMFEELGYKKVILNFKILNIIKMMIM